MAALDPGIERDEYDKIQRVFLSAKTGSGLNDLRDALGEFAADLGFHSLTTDHDVVDDQSDNV